MSCFKELYLKTLTEFVVEVIKDFDWRQCEVMNPKMIVRVLLF